ncbi:hypothetical protein CEK26_006259 [Fusarium fujikuroi]|uniref:Uncharacterized protein n=1 Tax=Fusarium fujikuroi TaxID=5127 RepID=A0A5Q3EJW8_FUSFU|nr:hypothetical protein CEK27_006265 [Fusarium fujikuroi]QGI79463.1 hypothetical protein CEK25_006192 [Fusarium fujikuroi]QGI93190.1 hypothetical protein CEK26_006259 [Fusarium fujikuroi]VTT77194.1 unnamed protein product [Fusarium fujikuroi]VTT77508.1 unnamed protein product [Fusarium fujikuroi]
MLQVQEPQRQHLSTFSITMLFPYGFAFRPFETREGNADSFLSCQVCDTRGVRFGLDKEYILDFCVADNANRKVVNLKTCNECFRTELQWRGAHRAAFFSWMKYHKQTTGAIRDSAHKTREYINKTRRTMRCTVTHDRSPLQNIIILEVYKSFPNDS